MSFSFDRPNLRERTRGKSGDEFMEEMLKSMKQKNRNFFDSHPKWKTSGFSFDDGLEREGSAGGSRSNLQAHLADLVSRHPELADSFVDLLPEEGLPETKGKKQESEPFTKDSQQQTTEINKPPQTTTQGTQTGSLESDIKLRNTVPDMQSSAQQHSGENCDNDRTQRSQSAPPQTSSSISAGSSSSKQKEEGIRLIPIRTDAPQSGPQMPAHPQQQHFQNQTVPQKSTPPHYPHSPHYPAHPHQPNSPQQYFQQNPQQQQFSDQRNHDERGPTVRHIPIFVEGRDEPILPKDAAPSGMKRGGCQGKADSAPGKRGAQPEEKQQPQQTNDQQPQQQQTPPSHHPLPKPDTLTQVAEVLKEVEELAARVNEWKGNSRSEKEYIYLDEMLTRNLLKLDNIETEGREEVRTARKDVIRRIQAAISILESKAAESSDQNSQIQSENETVNSFAATSQTEPMDTDEPKIEKSLQASQNSQISLT